MNTATLNLTASRRAPLLVPALIACYVLWGSTYFAIPIALASFPPFFQMGTRFLLAGALLMAWALIRRHKLPTLTHWRNALVVGSLMLGGGLGLVASASQYIGSGLIATFIAIVPMMVCGIGLLFGRRATRLELVGMGLGLAGVVLLMQGASFTASPIGVACVVGATLAWSLGSVLSANTLPIADGAAGFASEMLCGGAVLMLLSLALGEQPEWPAQPAALAAWLYLVVFGSLVAFSAYLYLLAHASPALATSYAFVNPLIALFLGVFFAQEVVTGVEWAACAVILAGVFFILAGSQKR